MLDVRTLGRIDVQILEAEYGKIQTDEIIVTNSPYKGTASGRLFPV